MKAWGKKRDREKQRSGYMSYGMGELRRQWEKLGRHKGKEGRREKGERGWVKTEDNTIHPSYI